MIISRYLIKEVMSSLLAVTFVLLLIFLSNQLVRYLSYAASGKMAANLLFQFLGFEIPYLLALLLPLGLYLGILLAYGRLYADSEMRVMHACGLSIRRLMMITSLLAFVMVLVVMTLTLWVNPRIAAEKEKIVASNTGTDSILGTLMPGRFQVLSDGKRVIYVEKMSRDRKLAKNIFIAEQKKSTTDVATPWVVMSAARGYQMKDRLTQDRFIVAADGYRYDGVPGQNDYQIIQFKKYAVRMPSTMGGIRTNQQETQPTAWLWHHYHDPASAAELQWRISLPLSVFLLALLAVPLSQVKPRQGRFVMLLPAILIYTIYVNLLFVARNLVEQKTVPIWIGIGWVHVLMLIVVGVLIMMWQGFRVRRA